MKGEANATVPVCRNCGAAAPGAYCPACGQETRRRLPTLAEFLREAAGRYVAFDGTWWKTLASLLSRPGFLTREYLAGRRRRYSRPARLFLVASLIMFAVLRIAAEFSTVRTLDAAAEVDARAVGIDDDRDFGELAAAVPALRERLERFNRLPQKERLDQIVSGMLRYGPYAAFALLPAFAAMLKLAYLGRHRRYPQRPRLYGEHLVFAAHNHAFVFFVVAAATAIRFEPLRWLLALWAFAYPLLSLRSVYGGPWLGIVVRAGALSLAYTVLFGVTTIGLLVAAILLR